MKRKISIMLMIALLITVFTGCSRPMDSEISIEEQTRIASNNMQNGSHFASDGKYLYCSEWDEGLTSTAFTKILKVNMDDFSIESTYDAITDYGDAFQPINMTYVDGNLYYYNWNNSTVLKQSTDMSNALVLPFSEYIDFLSTDGDFKTDGKYYYVTDYYFFNEPGIFRVPIKDIKEKTNVEKSLFTKISDLHAKNLYLQGEYLYFYSPEKNPDWEKSSNYGLWRIDLDGSNLIKISDNRPRHFIVSEDKIYFTEDVDCIYSMDLDGTNVQVLSEAYIDADLSITSMNIAGDYIFYNYATDNTIHRVNLDGTNDIQLNDCISTDIIPVGDWIIYRNEDDYKYYKMKFDGSSNCLISEKPLEEDLEEESSVVPADDIEVEVKRGIMTLEETLEDESGFFIKYADGSFDRYHKGNVLTWDSQLMTYGTDSYPSDLIMSLGAVEQNEKNLKDGQLVVLWPYEDRVTIDLYPVEESGHSLFRVDDDGKLEGLILTRGSSDGKGFTQWNQNKTFYWSNSVKYSTINGIPKEQYEGFPSTEGRDFGSFEPYQTYTVGIIEGTKLIEKEYTTGYKYFLHSDSSISYTLTPTTEGYAVLDLSDTPTGEYVFTVSRWDSERRGRLVMSTYINVK